MNELGIGWALEQMRNGKRVRRPGWNGRGMFLFLVGGEDWDIDPDSVSGERVDFVETTEKAPFIAMKTADDKIVPWLCSQTDLLADDWETAD